MQYSPFAEPSVRSELMEQVPHVVVYCQEKLPGLSNAVPSYILPMVAHLLDDGNDQVCIHCLFFALQFGSAVCGLVVCYNLVALFVV